MLLHYFVKCTQRIVHVKPLNFCPKKHQTLFRRTCGFQISHICNPVDYKIQVIMQRRVYQAKICSMEKRQVTGDRRLVWP